MHSPTGVGPTTARRWLPALPLLLLTAAPTCVPPTLTVMTYNVLHGQPCAGGSLGSEVEPRMELAVQGGPGGEPGLVALAPDVVGMQEVSQIFVDQAVAENQACMFLELAGGIPEGVDAVDGYEHAGDQLTRRMNGVTGARGVEAATTTSRGPERDSPYGMRFARDNPRILALIPDPPTGLDEQTLSDVAADLANLEIGLAVVSRLRIQRVTVHSLPPDEMPGGTRVLLHATLRDIYGNGYDFFNSHMTTGGGDTVPTQVQAQDIATFIAQNRRHPELPGFFVCDCNATPDTPAYQTFVDAGFVDSFGLANPGVDGFTSGRDGLSDDCSQVADKRIDYVFALPDDLGQVPAVVSSQVVMDYSDETSPGSCRFPSDHNGVVTTFDLWNLQ